MVGAGACARSDAAAQTIRMRPEWAVCISDKRNLRCNPWANGSALLELDLGRTDGGLMQLLTLTFRDLSTIAEPYHDACWYDVKYRIVELMGCMVAADSSLFQACSSWQLGSPLRRLTARLRCPPARRPT